MKDFGFTTNVKTLQKISYEVLFFSLILTIFKKNIFLKGLEGLL